MPVSETNKNLISTIDSGIKKEVSVGCGIEECVCSICGEDMRINTCGHIKGRYYDGKMCYGVLKFPTDVYEWAFTFQNQNETAKKIEQVKWQEKAMNKICREYLSKCKCCDECCAEFYCIENHLRSNCVPQDYCVDNLKTYLKTLVKL